ncbi:MAG: PDZ domain-containing protein [Acidobacteria bacterium]|nr:MAG: PDZ domain-containing protein [Acidobacteriota bacterium]REJ98895.1 MAG: PDZ domain-containing protein [Acidobacteriota bacterium]REK16385.1 MAG: PDZ domain-containing protein [Acidobacteriota bacterium]REK44066.1 MAG: PDZ domain-containing protein [Acidobacteriota bacterium]
MSKLTRETSQKNLLRELWIGSLSMILLALTSGAVVAQTPEVITNASSPAVSPEQLSASFAEVARVVEPAVVNIDTKGKVPDVQVEGDGEGEDDILEFFRRRLPSRPSYAVGSGFVVDPKGYILTNYHVVEDSSRITVRLQNGDEHVAKIVGADEETDLAVLKIEAGDSLPYLRFGNSDAARIGDWVLAVGSPFGLARTVTAGIISQTKRETPSGNPFQRFIQTDAAINRGNSGGPLVNLRGEVIGVNSQIATSTGDYNGIGFALPSNEAEYVYKQILNSGKVRRGYLGVYLDSVQKEFADVYGLPEAKGAIITSVRDQEGAAYKAGLEGNDIIVSVDGKTVESAQDLISKIASIEPGNDVVIGYLREKGNKLESRTVSVQLDERPSTDLVVEENERRSLPVEERAKQFSPLGLTLSEMNPNFNRTFTHRGVKLGEIFESNDLSGLIVRSVDPASFVSDVKDSSGRPALSEGDLIHRLNRVNVTDLDTFNRIADRLKKGSPVVIHVATYDRRSRTVVPRIVQFTIQ